MPIPWGEGGRILNSYNAPLLKPTENEGSVARVKLFYGRGIRVLQLVHYRISEIDDILTSELGHNGLTWSDCEVVREGFIQKKWIT